jgi:RND superfamily putative drug exporter
MLAWVLVMGLLAVRGLGLESKLSSRPAYIDGTQTARAHSIAVRQFGGEDTQVAMLRGPRAAVDRQGAALARHLEATSDTLVISPWGSGGTIDGLRPQPNVAALLINTERAPGETAAPDLEGELREEIHAPVQVSVAGGPAIVNSLHDSIESATETGEKLAVPVLLIVLMFVCRSLLAASMPILIGGTVAGAAKGVLDLIHGFVGLDPFALGAAAMLGLALGVDYSLLVVARFRQERQGEDDHVAAAYRTVIATGQSVIPAGGGLFLAMIIAALMLPGLVGSIAIAAAAVALLSVFSALLATPALLLLCDRYLDRWSLPPRRDDGGAVMRWSRRISSRPPLVLGLVFLLVVSALWAITIDTGSGTVDQLPPNDSGRLQQEDIQRTLGAGWTGPLEVVMNGRDQPVTTPARLRALADFQRRVEKDPGVDTMAGFTAFEDSTEQLGGVEGGLVDQEQGLDRLDRSLVRIQGGAGATTDGFISAAEGAQELGAAVGSTRSGSSSLAAGLRDSSDGSERLSGGLDHVGKGSGSVAHGASEASAGATKLADKVAEAEKQSEQQSSSTRVLENALTVGEDALVGVEAPIEATEAQLAAAWGALEQMTSGRSDPQYRAAADAVAAAIGQMTGAPPGSEEAPETVKGGVAKGKDQFDLGLYLTAQMAERNEKSQKGVAALARSSAKLDRGLRKLKRGSRKVSDGIGNLSGGSEKLTPGLQRLTAGAEQLSGGLGQIAAGTAQLSGGLGSGAQRSRLLSGGLHKVHAGLERQQGGAGGSQLDRLRRSSPGLFRSGYFYLAGFDGAKPRQRRQTGLLVNLNRGATAARMLVIPADEPASSEAAAMTSRVRADAEELAAATDSEVVAGGWGSVLTDLNSALRDRGPVIRLVLSLVTILILLLVTRSLALALIAAALNLLTVSATFGLLALLFDGSLLGGPGYVDSSLIAVSVTLVFGLAIDYEVFIFARMREEYLRTGSTELAIDNGLAKTAHVITGAALIMCAVFLAFAASPLIALRNLSIGLTIATVIDALAIRFVLVPAAMRMLGDRSWWIPRWLDRLLPGQSAPAPPAGSAA